MVFTGSVSFSTFSAFHVFGARSDAGAARWMPPPARVRAPLYNRAAMHFTIFDTPIIRDLFRWLSIVMLRLCGWKLKGAFPAQDKYVMIGAPHTSNWDFPITLGLCFAARAKIYWMGKHTLFKGPMGPVMRWLGGVPVARHQSNSLVQQMVDVFQRSDRLVLAIPPEGTRKAVKEWKTGFYHIACGAGVPIALAYLDYGRKEGGFGPLFQPSGDIEADMPRIRAFYADKQGRYPR
ncbi:lysophospholipid acyltransferase family protein [Chromobacterium violaceum]|nr:lysophospholipid acyltransferase family protein [Chromobacterium violaceum]QRO33210.1 lysophospholipid acyltransferase family protein [Chromobacterium violaceum]QRQ16988.1 lysophospholipid acyltransferase family protein [Chromobacterium violaceum]